MGSPYHQPVISHSSSRLTIDSDSEPDFGDAVDSARTTKRFLFRGRYSYRESSQQPELFVLETLRIVPLSTMLAILGTTLIL